MKRTVRAGTLRLEYELVRQARRDILLKVLPGGVIRVYAPGYAQLRAVDDVVRARAGELTRLQDQVERAWRESRAQNALRDGRLIWYQGKQYALRLSAGRAAVAFADGAARVSVPDPRRRGRRPRRTAGLALRPGPGAHPRPAGLLHPPRRPPAGANHHPRTEDPLGQLLQQE